MFNIVINCSLVLQKCNIVIYFYKNVIKRTKNRYFWVVQGTIFVANFIASIVKALLLELVMSSWKEP